MKSKAAEYLFVSDDDQDYIQEPKVLLQRFNQARNLTYNISNLLGVKTKAS